MTFSKYDWALYGLSVGHLDHSVIDSIASNIGMAFVPFMFHGIVDSLP